MSRLHPVAFFTAFLLGISMSSCGRREAIIDTSTTNHGPNNPCVHEGELDFAKLDIRAAVCFDSQLAGGTKPTFQLAFWSPKQSGASRAKPEKLPEVEIESGFLMDCCGMPNHLEIKTLESGVRVAVPKKALSSAKKYTLYLTIRRRGVREECSVGEFPST